jgi:hypothetical protein
MVRLLWYRFRSARRPASHPKRQTRLLPCGSGDEHSPRGQPLDNLPNGLIQTRLSLCQRSSDKRVTVTLRRSIRPRRTRTGRGGTRPVSGSRVRRRLPVLPGPARLEAAQEAACSLATAKSNTGPRPACATAKESANGVAVLDSRQIWRGSFKILLRPKRRSLGQTAQLRRQRCRRARPAHLSRPQSHCSGRTAAAGSSRMDRRGHDLARST